MKCGLVIGKFLPLHEGHIALIRFAASQCDSVIVSMSFTPLDAIDYQIRFSWLKEVFRNQPAIRPDLTRDDFDDPSLPLVERTKVWAAYISKRFPEVDAVFSSEEYGDPFATHLGVKHISFDPPRLSVPVSATLIRSDPWKYWKYIPAVVRPYFVRKVCFYGPESTGKSTMAKRFAGLYHTEFVPEVARELITSNDFSVEDIVSIGKAQTQRVHEKAAVANKILFCDTDVITTQIYSHHYLHDTPLILVELEKQIVYDRYFLFDIDLPWVADDIRDLGERREEMMRVFKHALIERNISWCFVTGSIQERESIIQDELNKLGMTRD